MSKLMQKYTPRTMNDIIIDEKNLDTIITFANGWLQGFPNINKPSIIFRGHPGTGKTLMARCLCNDCDFSILELNASESRTKDQLIRLLNVPSHDFFGKRICLFLDEVDSQDNGNKGTEAILKKVIMQMKFPVIMAANNIMKVPKVLKDISEPVQFFRPSAKVLKEHVLKINRQENLNLPTDIIEAASNSQDYRMAYQIIEARQILKQKDRKLTDTEITKNIMTHQPIQSLDLPEKKGLMDINKRLRLLYYLDENCHLGYDVFDTYLMYEEMYKLDKYNRRGQVSFYNSEIRNLPIATKEVGDIKSPIYYEKIKNSKENNNINGKADEFL